MGAISALSTAVETLKRNLVLLAAAFVVAVVNFGLSAAPVALPEPMAVVASLSLSGLTFLLTPFFIGGLLAMAAEGLSGTTDFGTFLTGGRANYLRIFAAMVVFGIGMFAVTIATLIGVAVIGTFALGMGNMGDPTAGGSMAGAGAGIAVMLVFALVVMLALLVPIFFLQFYAPAIVVSDLGVVAAFKRSAALVRRNLVSTLGYMAVSLVLGTVAGVVGFVFVAAGGISAGTALVGAGSETAGLVVTFGALVLATVVTTAVSALGSVYQVAFYDDRLDSLA